MIDTVTFGNVITITLAFVSVIGSYWKLKNESDKNRDESKYLKDSLSVLKSNVSAEVDKRDGHLGLLNDKYIELNTKLAVKDQADTERDRKIDHLVKAVDALAVQLPSMNATLENIAKKIEV